MRHGRLEAVNEDRDGDCPLTNGYKDVAKRHKLLAQSVRKSAAESRRDQLEGPSDNVSHLA
jgi:hypothetical protein